MPHRSVHASCKSPTINNGGRWDSVISDLCGLPPTFPEHPEEQRDHGKGEENVQNPWRAIGDRQKEKHEINHVALCDLMNESGQRPTQKTLREVEVFLPARDHTLGIAREERREITPKPARHDKERDQALDQINEANVC